jgi:hypothetical protein
VSNILQQIDFGNEAGDDVDPEELVTYFVEQDTFKSFVDPKKRILVATAKKGVGKSALLKWTGFTIGIADSDAISNRLPRSGSVEE